LIPTVSGETLRDFPDRAIQGLTQRRRLGIEVGRRKEIGASRRRSRPRLSNPSKRRCQIEILVERSLDDASEVRVIEGQPPFVQAVGSAALVLPTGAWWKLAKVGLLGW
jgi:hypothetical protein